MKKQKGFTLIELLVVIAIIGLLSTLAVVALSSARAKARDAKRVADVKQIQSALELYYNDKNGYPVFATPGVVLGGASYDLLCDTSAGFQGDGTGCTVTYMGQVPPNPTPNGADYTYIGSASTYSIAFNLEGATGGLAAGAHTASPSGIQ